jgi:hypothetical protein
MVYAPTKATVEAERTCISNIHRGGTPPVEAAGRHRRSRQTDAGPEDQRHRSESSPNA